MRDETENVVAFPKGAELPPRPVEIDHATGRYCNHLNRIRLDEHARALFCAECGASLDPFDFLLRSGKWMLSAWSEHGFVAAEVRRRQEEIASLKKEARRLSAQVKRLREKAPDNVLDCRRTP